MVQLSSNKWCILKLKRMSIPTRKLPLLVIGFVLMLIYLFNSKLSQLEELQTKCIQDIQTVAKQAAKVQSNVQIPINNCPATTTKRKYLLIAQNSEGQYLEHVRNVFSYLGYERVFDKSSHWDVLWAYDYPFPSLVNTNSLKSHQMVNHVPGTGYLTSKVSLATSKFKYIPTAFSLPREKDLFLAHAKEHKDKLWVQKSNKHRGITIKSIDELDLTAKDAFVQEFVQNPYLVDGRKFDIGIYTIITSIDPLRVYVLDTEWLLRYCTEDYLPFDVHDPKKYVIGDDYAPTWKLPSLTKVYNELKFSHKESLFYYIELQGHDSAKLEKEIYEAVAEMAYQKKPDILKSVSRYTYGLTAFFELVRFDFVIDAKLNVYLMEVNMSPNLSSAHFKPNGVMYEQVLMTTLSLVGLSRATNAIENIDTVLANDRDIQVYGKECRLCNACDSDTCKLCQSCLTDSQKSMLKSAYREHLNRAHAVRVYPQPSHVQGDVKALKNLSEKDKMMHFWYKGMCQKSKSWC